MTSEEIAEALEQYATALESGNDELASRLLLRHPVLTTHFEGHLQSLQLIEGQSLEQAIIELQRRGSLGVGSNNHSTVKACQSTWPEGSVCGQLNSFASVRNSHFVRTAVELGIHVADAIEYAHQQGVVHRDTKPSNLMLDRMGKIWVTDFGLARCPSAANLTSQGERLGTARYMSPEQAAGRTQDIDYRTDIYSLGVTLYELLTLRHAFDFSSRDELLQAIESRDPVSPRKLNPAISVDLETILMKAIAKRSVDRYASAGEFANDLRRFLDGKPTQARRPTVADRVTKWAVRHQRWVAATLVLMMLAYTGVFMAMSVIAHQRDREMASAERARFHLQQSHHVVDRFGGILSDYLSNVSGSDAIRAELVNEAIRYYTDFLQYADSDRDLQQEAGIARYQLAIAYGRLGKIDESEKQYLGAIRKLQESERSMDSTAQLSVLASCWNDLGVIYRNDGRFALAESELSKAVEAYQTLTIDVSDQHAHDRPHAIALARLPSRTWLCCIGRWAIKTNRPACSQKVLTCLKRVYVTRLTRSIQTSDSLFKSDCLNAAITTSQCLPRSIRRQPRSSGEILWKKRSWELFEQAFAKSELLLRDEAAKNPRDPESLSRLAGVLNNIALLAESRSEFQVASQRLTQAIENQTQAIKLAPLNTVYRKSLVLHQQNLDRTLRSIQFEVSGQHPLSIKIPSPKISTAELIATGDEGKEE